jgi:hypothetical protein
MTGGKMRDTLAGLFDDRAARRFAYKALTPWLLLTSALAMLLMVAARRVGVPDVVSGLATRIRTSRDAVAARRRERDAEAARAQALATQEQLRLRDAIAARRQREVSPPRELPSIPFDPRPPAAPQPLDLPRSPSLSGPPAATPERPLTAAERLALKRRERR